MKIGAKGLEIIKRYEGLELESYLCPAGVWTIGYGHTKGVKQGMKITVEQADIFLQSDLRDSEACVNSKGLSLDQNQYDALVSLVFNIGCGNFSGSTLLKYIRANKNCADIERQFGRWIYGNKKPLPGLIKRRKEEAKLYCGL